MKNRYAKYFGKNISRTVYVIGSGLSCVGLFCILFSHRGFGLLSCVVGVTLFFLTSHLQISDKTIDELLEKAITNYKKEKIEGVVVGKTELAPERFYEFNGFIRDNGEVRFKRGRDEKIRTSRYFVTAISAEKKDFCVFTTVYDMLAETEESRMCCSLGAEEISFDKEIIEFPQKLRKCSLKLKKENSCEEMTFYLPADALADKLIDKIEDIAKE